MIGAFSFWAAYFSMGLIERCKSCGVGGDGMKMTWRCETKMMALFVAAMNLPCFQAHVMRKMRYSLLFKNDNVVLM
ncbi:hypothetical protein CFN79_06330 [Chromobacterium vaccinii]|nr:hypothetical protein CFN79_06330 [Chromobacterium vaccinii]